MAYDTRDEFDRMNHRLKEQQRGQMVLSPSDFAALAKGKTLGKRGILQTTGTGFFPETGQAVNTMVDLLDLRSDDDTYAQNLGVTLAPPKFVPNDIAVAPLPPLPANIQNVTGEVDNTNTQFPTFLWTGLAAQVSWGIGGIDSQAIVDFQNGATFNVYASYLRIKGIVSGGIIGHNSFFVLGAYVGPSHTSPSNARFSQFIFDIAAGADSGVFQVPFFAKNVNVTFNNAVANANITFFRNRTATVATVGTFQFTGAQEKAPVPFVGYYYRVHNNSAALASAIVTFDLSI